MEALFSTSEGSADDGIGGEWEKYGGEGFSDLRAWLMCGTRTNEGKTNYPNRHKTYSLRLEI
jgi:hypothetical protein